MGGIHIVLLIQFCFVWTKIIRSTLILYNMITSFSQHTVMYISVKKKKKKKKNMINMDTLKTYFFGGGHTSNLTII